MATISEIYQEIITAKEAEANLSGLDSVAGENMQTFINEMSSSKVSIWKLWAYIVAFFLWSFQKTDDIFIIEVEQWAALKQVTTLKWYQQQVLNFLLGKELVWDEDLGKFVQELLPADDEDLLKIIKYCAVTKSPNKLRVKIAKQVGGIPSQVPIAEATALGSFLNQIKSAGDTIEIVNNAADKLQIEIDVFIDPLLINVSSGELHQEAGVEPVKNAIDQYLLNLDFNGRFTNTFLIDAVQAATGVVNVDLKTIKKRYAAFPYADILVSDIPEAGYYEIESLTINYKPAEV